jgi:hypothetical protein
VREATEEHNWENNRIVGEHMRAANLFLSNFVKSVNLISRFCLSDENSNCLEIGRLLYFDFLKHSLDLGLISK